MELDSSLGYRYMDTWVMSSVILLGTYHFCEKFLEYKFDPKGRQYDQMVQAARSGKANIVEGAARASTSKETEMKLTDVARASLTELHSDYEDWLMRRGQVPWHKNNPEAQKVFNIHFDHPEYGDDFLYGSCVHVLNQKKKFAQWLDSDDSDIFANCMIILLRRAIKMLGGQLKALADAFEKTGGFREQLTAVRTEARAKQANAPLCPECGKPMHRRTASSGKNKGKEFWGCSGYPECRGTRRFEDV
ncbi:MAG: four helix bundle suffix domain-containing protein [Tannerella sp.]|jgi:four helix bundle suffix protein|nr:four helix bundle suffix domain-containing protein [Tannerella sp.]